MNICFERKGNPWYLKVKNYKKWSLGQIFQKFTTLVPVLSILAKIVPGIFKFWKISFMVIILLECDKFGPLE